MRIALFLLAFAAVFVVANPNIEERKKKKAQTTYSSCNSPARSYGGS